MERNLTKEILDSLPEDDPAAIASRRDLRRINAILGNYSWLGAQVELLAKEETPRPLRVLEIGAGEGMLSRHIHSKNIHLTGLDRCSRPTGWPENWGWIQEDLMCCDWPSVDVVVANLIFHHFSNEDLVRLGKKLPASCRWIFACEPVRRTVHIRQLEILGLFGLHPVTRHDGKVSIEAGFRGEELAEALGCGWDFEANETWIGSYRFKAHRK